MNILQVIQAIQTILNAPSMGFGTGVLGPLQPLLVKFMSATPLELTTTNQVVIGVWGTVLAIADAFFLLLILIGTIQIMISNSTGSLTLPLSQFVPKIIVTTLLMNLSFFLARICSSLIMCYVAQSMPTLPDSSTRSTTEPRSHKHKASYSILGSSSC